MDISDLGETATPKPNKQAKKRVPQPSKWKRNIEKNARYASKPPIIVRCNHSTKAMKCSTLTAKDVENFNQRFYSEDDKQQQDNFILLHTEQHEPARVIPSDNKKFVHKLSVKYYITKKSNKAKGIPVCQKFFLGALNVGKHRVRGVIDRFFTTGCSPTEKRGGARLNESNIKKRLSVKKFIESLPVSPKLYCRSQVKCKQYLPAEWNIDRLRNMYNEQHTEEFQVKKWFFNNIFNTEYKLAFHSPKCDVCPDCSQCT